MAGFRDMLVGFFLIATKYGVTFAYEYCYGEYCTDSESCCGSGYSSYCCSDAASWKTIVGAIGGVIGGITLLSVIISCVCVIYKKHNRPNLVVRPTVGMVSATNASMGYTGNMPPQQQYGGYPMQGYTGYPNQPVAGPAGIQNYPPPYPAKSDNASSDNSSIIALT